MKRNDKKNIQSIYCRRKERRGRADFRMDRSFQGKKKLSRNIEEF
jgi:hypothetical protein